MAARCPFCKEKINNRAEKCKHCGEWLPQKEKKDSFLEKVLKAFIILMIGSYLIAMFPGWLLATAIFSCLILLINKFSPGRLPQVFLIKQITEKTKGKELRYFLLISFFIPFFAGFTYLSYDHKNNEKKLAQEKIQKEKENKNQFNKLVAEGNKAFLSKAFDEAYKNYDKAIKYGKLSEKEKRQFAQIINNKAIEFLKTTEISKAEGEFRKINKVFPNFSESEKLRIKIDEARLSKKLKELEQNKKNPLSITKKDYIIILADVKIWPGKRSINAGAFAVAKKGEVFELAEKKPIGNYYSIYLASGEDRYINKNYAKPIKYSDIKLDFPADLKKQKQLGLEILLAQDCSDVEAEKRHPLSLSLDKHVDYKRILQDAYELEAARRFGYKTSHLLNFLLSRNTTEYKWDENTFDKFRAYCSQQGRDKFRPIVF